MMIEKVEKVITLKQLVAKLRKTHPFFTIESRFNAIFRQHHTHTEKFAYIAKKV